MGTVLARVGGRYRHLTLRAMAYAIQQELGEAGVPSPLPPIDYDATRLGRVRREVRADLRDRLRREPSRAEIASGVAKEYHKGEPAVEAAERKMRRLIREAQRFEFVHLGVDIDDYLDEQGELILRVRKRQSTKRPLPPARPHLTS
jgi:hypothetical protein